MMNNGTSTSRPQRIPTWPEIQPMIGSTISPGDHPQRRHGEAGRPGPRRDRQREGDQDARAEHGQRCRDHAVDRDREHDVGREREAQSPRSRCRSATCDEEADQAAHVAHEASGDDARPEHQTDQLERFGDGRGEAPGPFVEPELLLVEQRGQGDEADQRRRQERQAPPDPFEALDLLHRAPTLGGRRARSPRWRSRRRWRPSPGAPTGRGSARGAASRSRRRPATG